MSTDAAPSLLTPYPLKRGTLHQLVYLLIYFFGWLRMPPHSAPLAEQSSRVCKFFSSLFGGGGRGIGPVAAPQNPTGNMRLLRFEFQ